MKLLQLKESAAFSLTAEQRFSFAGTPRPFQISGPPGLVRLVQRGRSRVGAFWFEEPVFSRLREQAKRDLAQQSSENKQPFSRPMKELIGMYMKHCLRSDLAICKDWTENFDSYVVLPLRPLDSVVAWVGPIKQQPYYSQPVMGETDYAAKKATHDLAKTAGVGLIASEKQYVIHFDFPANRSSENRLLGPWDF